MTCADDSSIQGGRGRSNEFVFEPFLREDRGQESLNDLEVVEWIDSNGPASPRQIPEMRRSERQIRLQCRYLAEIGLLTVLGGETYEVSEKGRDVLADRVSLSVSDGYVDVEQHLSIPDERITDLSRLSQIVIKKQNSEFYEKARDPDRELDHEYSVDIQDTRRERTKVWSAKQWKLDRLLREFPMIEPVVSQCAHWMRSLAGLHLFPDANHRTGMATLSRLVLSNDIIGVDHPWPGATIGNAVLLSKFHRYLSARVNFTTLWKYDSLYWHWFQYFDHLLYGARYPALTKHSENQLRKKLQLVRRRI